MIYYDVLVPKASHEKHVKSISDLQAARQHHSSIPERMDYMEKLLGDL